jgi:DNA-binding NarL/FixJ family response regulator
MENHQLAVIVVEDDSAARAAIALLLRAERLRVAGLAGNARVEKALLERHRYGVTVLDVHLDVDSGLGMAEDRRRRPNCPVALFTGYAEADVILHEAARLGTRGFAMTCSDALIPARRDIPERRSFELEFSPQSSRRSESPERTRLDADEHAILGMLAAGLTRSAIAQRLVLDPETVHAHIGAASAKLATTTRVLAVAALVRSRGVGRPHAFVTA